MTKRSPFRYFKTSPEIIRLAVMLYIRFPLSLRNVEDLLHERGIEISHETVRYWWNRFGPICPPSAPLGRFGVLAQRVNSDDIHVSWHATWGMSVQIGPPVEGRSITVRELPGGRSADLQSGPKVRHRIIPNQ